MPSLLAQREASQEKGMHHFCPHFMGQHLVICPSSYLQERLGNVIPVYLRRKGLIDIYSLAVS